MFALVHDAKVVQIEPATFPVAPEMAWIDLTGVTPAPEVGWGFDGSDFTAPPPPAPPPTDDEIYDQVIQNQKVLKGYILAVNDGSIVPGANMTGAALKAAVKAKM